MSESTGAGSGITAPVREPGSVLHLELASLRRELQQVNALFEGVGKFYEGWSRLLSSAIDEATANYTAAGKPVVSISKQSNSVVIHG